MSLHRRAARRDDNEGAIRERFAQHGWHTETLSAAGMPDLMVIPERQARDTLSAFGLPGGQLRLFAFVDVKNGKGEFKPAQLKKWPQLAAKGIPVYVCRTPEDVDALVRGELAPWQPERKTAPALEAVFHAEAKGERTSRPKRTGAPTPAVHRPVKGTP